MTREPAPLTMALTHPTAKCPTEVRRISDANQPANWSLK